MRTRAKRQNIISNIFLKIPGMTGKRIEFERNIKYNVLVLKIGDKIKRGRYRMKKRNMYAAVLLTAILSVTSLGSAGHVQAAGDTSGVRLQTVSAEKGNALTTDVLTKDTGKSQKKLAIQAGATKQKAALTGKGKNVRAKATTKKDTSYIPVVKGVTGSEEGKQGNVALGNSVGTTDGTMGKRYLYSQKVEFQGKGSFSFSVKCTEAKTAGRNVVYGVFKQASLEDPIDKSSVDVVTKKGDHKTVVVKIPKAGTYYIGIYTMVNAKDKSESWKFTTGAIYWNGNNRTITSDKKIAVGHKTTQTNYFKMKTTESGYITVIASDPKNKIVLYDSKKNRLTESTIAKYGVTYGVPKGRTYYIKVWSPASEDGGYTLVAKNRKISEKSGSSKSNAVEIKKNTTIKGTMETGVKRTDWYKIRLTSKRSVELSWKARTNEKMKLAIYQGSRKIDTKTLTYADASYKLKSVGKWPKDTYYLKVYTDTEKSSGWYILRWN